MSEHTDHNDAFDDEFDELFARAETSKAGKYISQLSPRHLAKLDEFTEQVLNVEHTEASVKSYRSYIAKAIVLPNEKLTNDQKSAVRKFRRWLQK